MSDPSGNGGNPPEKPNWVGKACPYSFGPQGHAQQPASRIISGPVEQISAPTQERDVMACLGPQCMHYVPMQEQDEKGNLSLSIHGACAPVIHVAALNQQTEALNRFMAEYQLRRKN